MGVEGVKKEIEKLPKFDKSTVITRVVFDLFQELQGEAACSDQLKELFGIDCLEKLDKRLETGI